MSGFLFGATELYHQSVKWRHLSTTAFQIAGSSNVSAKACADYKKENTKAPL